MSRSRKDNTMLGAMGVLVLFASYNFLIRPQGTELSALRDERSVVDQGVSDAELILLAPLDTTVAQPGADAAALTASVPADEAIATLLRQLQTIAGDTGMLHGSISPLLPELNPNGPGGSLQINISATGSHEAALEYVERVRDLERLVVIERIGLSIQPDATEQLQITARVFTQRAPANPLSSP